MPRSAAGYSGTPLAKKLGIGTDARVLVLGEPAHYRRLLAPIPVGVRFATRVNAGLDVVHVFATGRADLAERLAVLRRRLNPDAAIWVSWPKRAARVPTTISEDVIRELALPLGFVDVKVCAVDDVWSGLKLVVRKELR